MKGTFAPQAPLDLKTDAVIIGSGAGGASVADVLTRAGLDVVMLEEGPYVPAARVRPRASEAMPLLWRNGGLTAALGAPPVAYAEGRCVGGGTEINSAIFQSPASELIDEWAERYAIRDLSAASLAPYLQRAATAVNASPTPGALGAPSDILARAGERLGWKVSHLERGHRHCVGTNMCSFGCPTGAKQSMTSSLLPLAVGRGLRLVAGTRISRLKLVNGRVAEVLGESAGGRVRVRADLVFACCGAVHTPTLLLRSGLRRGIGRSLRMHPTIKCIAQFDTPVDAHLHRLSLNAITEFMPGQRIGGSVFTPALFATSLAEDWTTRASLMKDWRNCAIYYAMIRAGGTGSVRVLPGVAEPIVTYRLTDGDWSALCAALGRLAEAMFAAGARRVIPSITGHAGWSSTGEALADVDANLPRERCNLMTIHLFSSCPPGERADVCATDSFGRLHGVSNLFVADASLIPEAPGCNPQATIMALAFRTAEAALDLKCGNVAAVAAIH